MNHLFCFGLGFCGKALAARLRQKGWRITGTSRDAAGAAAIHALGYESFIFDGAAPMPQHVFQGITHILVSVPPDRAGDPVLRTHENFLPDSLKWLGYLSTTGVYGNRDGGWVSEESPLQPATERGHRRLQAEAAWLAKDGLPHIFRLAGIYGPGRNALVSLLKGSARRIIKPGQVFSRIHVEDAAQVLEASMAQPNAGRAYNVCDDEPCPPQDVIAHAARLLKAPAPPETAFEEARLSPMAQSFYQESKRVSNARIKNELGIELMYPTYREGLASLLKGIKR
ncbi:MAG TPA: SDR family oxidoreductase [Aestuariivirga sp.]|nr:SDR family oxidoreductase [Aestuariivirga sp.]